jgi:hypothetical protein
MPKLLSQPKSLEASNTERLSFFKDHSGATFHERYYRNLRNGRAAPDIGRLAVGEMDPMDRRFYVEMASGFCEALKGRVDTHYQFDVVKGKIVADDQEPLEIMMNRSLYSALELANNFPEMGFVADRFSAEVNELNDQQLMATGETNYNTLITSSPMTFELAHRPDLLKSGFQRPDLKRSMVRISHWDGNKMHVFTRSLDNGSLQLFTQAIQEATGHEFTQTHSTDVLNDRIHKTMNLGQVQILLDLVCMIYDRLMYEQTGRRTVQGAVEPDDIDLTKFIESHKEILDSLRSKSVEIAHESASYTDFESRFSRETYNHLAYFDEILKGASHYDSVAIGASASDAGARAAERGEVYSICGELLSGATASVIGAESSYGVLTISARMDIVNNMSNRVGRGTCFNCDKYDQDLYGCGVYCRSCNKEWCRIVLSTGRMPEDIRFGKKQKQAIKDKQKNHKKAVRAENKAIKNARQVLRDESSFFSGWEFFTRREKQL